MIRMVEEVLVRDPGFLRRRAGPPGQQRGPGKWMQRGGSEDGRFALRHRPLTPRSLLTDCARHNADPDARGSASIVSG